MIDLPANIDYFQIVGVHVDPDTLGLRLEIVDPIAKLYYELVFAHLLFISISNTQGDDDGVYQILELKVLELQEPEAALNRLGYHFRETAHQGTAFHLHVEGDICIDVVSDSFELKGPLKGGRPYVER